MINFDINYKHDISYSLKISNNIFSIDNDLLMSGRDGNSKSCFIIVDCKVYDLYKDKINRYFETKTESFEICLVAGEDKTKNIKVFERISEALNNYPLNRRNEPVIIIGGGVATDIGAFVTSCYRRGIPHIKVPTTVMGYVDASVGIKTGINFGGYKNRMGSFYPPHTVLLDKSFFKSLTERDICNGVGEIIKIAVIKNEKLFEAIEDNAKSLLESKFQHGCSDFVLSESIKDMVDELSPNLFEDNLERIVDFGHTFSLVFEMDSRSDIKHGEAVAMDIMFSSYLSFKRGLINSVQLNRIINVIHSYNMPIHYDQFEPKHLWKSLEERVCHRNGRQLVPVPYGIGASVFLNDIDINELSEVCDIIKKKQIC